MILKTKLILLIPLLVFIISCQDSREPNDLMFGFMSYSNDELIRESSKDSIWSIKEHTLIEDSRPRYEFLTISSDVNINENMRGIVELDFFNDMLMQARFFPVSIQEASDNQLAALEKNKADGVKCWSNRDINEKLFISCVERSILRKHENWIRKYS